MTEVKSIINFIGENNCEFKGNFNLELNSVNNISDALSNQVSYCKFSDQKGKKLVENSNAGLIIVPTELKDLIVHIQNKNILFTDEPRFDFIRVCQKFFPMKKLTGRHSTALIGENCQISNDVYLGKYVSIGDNVKIGSGSVLYDGVKVYDNITIGNNCIINSGTVIGADGFGYEKDKEGNVIKFPHYGSVIIEDDVEVGANTCIDRGTLGNTIIQQGAKIDNLCHIAHNVNVGKNAFIIALSMIGGSVKIGDNSWIAPSSSLINGIQVGHNSIVGLGAVVLKDVENDSTVIGVPAKKLSTSKK